MKIAKKKDKITVSFIDEPASEDVTGSLVYISTSNHNICVDVGLHQTNDKYEDFLINNRKWKEFKPKDIDLVFITHCHGDHSLLLPRFFKNGCDAGVIISEGSLGSYKTMLEDAAYINERDILVINNQNNKNYEPLYTIKDVENTVNHLLEKPVNQKITIDDEISFKLVPAGHLLGSCQVLLYVTINGLTKTICISGDLGNNSIKNHFVGEFQPISHCDLFIGEATYGDRPDIKTGIKERKNDLEKLKSIVDTQVKEMNGRVLIPSFAQSRCQQLALMLYELYKDEQWQPKVYIDSPLAISIFKEYGQVLEGEEKDLFDEMLKWDKLIFVQESEESKTLVAGKEPCCIISTSGMCQVGRVRHHIKSMVSNPNATILFVGFSTEGSLASLLKDNKRKTITIDTKEYPCRCASYSLKSMSGHMPFYQLVEYYSEINCNKIILHHGSSSAKENLAEHLRKKLEYKCKTTRVVIANSSLKFGI